MFTIGEFAGHGRVSARMLRHYDTIGLLRPARTDPVTGYRYYEAGQLARLNRIIALKDLGFSLQQVTAILDEQVSAAELRGMLRLRRAELAAAVTAAGARLARVEARLRTIEGEGRMAAEEVVVKRVEAVRVAQLTGTAASFGPEDIGPVVGPLYDELLRRLAAAGVEPTGPGIAHYADAPGGGDRITVHAAVVVAAAPQPSHDFAVVDLPPLAQAATVVHRGPMERVLPTAQVLARWLDDSPYRSAGYPRELTLECPEDREAWVTELQEPITVER
ncbi:MerR family transcriptional regulator [Streptomyces monomycini]|uniref:MerR family transcriptional regulator n=1 Tax=Streptomyces monomycini TaxID=371720 RepID=UPI0004AA7D2E|nr:MerR family transcriptional regulator [Streptomyces monomycini]